MYNKILKEIMSLKNEEKAKFLSGFFKTGKGEYGEGDIFLGITVPVSREIAQRYGELSMTDISKLLKNKYHEVRLIALLILVHKYNIATKANDNKTRKEIVDFYLQHTEYINNWDLVDLSAHYIVGNYLIDKDRKILLKLVKSSNIWERRIAIISTFAFIYKGEGEWTFKIATLLMKDKEDLIQKACGWMLREVGKRVKEKDLILYLDEYVKVMPRTMLRYAIERLPEVKRKYYLKLR
jgi:3-methyladenine DNA glycosylase AlkD